MNSGINCLLIPDGAIARKVNCVKGKVVTEQIVYPYKETICEQVYETVCDLKWKKGAIKLSASNWAKFKKKNPFQNRT